MIIIIIIKNIMYIYITKVSLKYANEVKYIVSTSIKILTLVIWRFLMALSLCSP